MLLGVPVVGTEGSRVAKNISKAMARNSYVKQRWKEILSKAYRYISAENEDLPKIKNDGVIRLEFKTHQIIHDIHIPKEDWNKGIVDEPIYMAGILIRKRNVVVCI
jgi:hypothetical protein